MPNFLQGVDHEVVTGVVVSILVGVITWTLRKSWKVVTGASAMLVEPPAPAPPIDLSSLENSSRATWALLLGIASYFLWFIAFPLVFPAIGLCLWFGFNGRRAKNRFAAQTGIYAALFHILLIVVIAVLLIVGSQSYHRTNLY